MILSVSCGTMRLQVKSPYKSSQGNGQITYERSYDVGGAMPLWCGVSAIFYGGACWAYLAMPFVPQEEKVLKDAVNELNTKSGATDTVLEAPEVKRISWSSAEPFTQIDP